MVKATKPFSKSFIFIACSLRMAASIIKKVKVHGNIANLLECSHKKKSNPKLKRIVQMVEEELRKTSKTMLAEL